MTINLITQEEYKLLLDIQKESPILTLENKGYETIEKSKFTEKDQDCFEEVDTILRKAIIGFVEFNNFKHTKDGRLVLRFQYDWTRDDEYRRISFTGVGYILLDELLNGFETKIEQHATGDNNN